MWLVVRACVLLQVFCVFYSVWCWLFVSVFGRRVTSSLSPVLQNYFAQHTQCCFLMSFLRNYFASQSGCLLIKVLLNLLVANGQD